MLNITNENLHVYVFALFALIFICFAVEFYNKSVLETEINNLKKKQKKFTQFITNIKKMEQIRQQQMQQQNEQEVNQYNDEDSYIDPMMG